MKKLAVTLVLCLCTALFFGCGKSESGSGSTAESSQKSSSDEFDFDLTKMSSTMVYSTVYSMITAPDEYEGKTVKVTGNFNEYKDASTGKTYYSVLIADATACCQQGLEFDMGSGFSDYPPENALITVTGTFGTYMEGNMKYCQLEKATLKRE